MNAHEVNCWYTNEGVFYRIAVPLTLAALILLGCFIRKTFLDWRNRRR